MALSETTTRVLVAAVGIPVAVAAVVAGGWALAALIGALAVVSSLEFFRLVEKRGVEPIVAVGVAVAALFVLLAALRPGAGPDGAGFATLIVASTLVLLTVSIWGRGVAGQPTLATSATLAGAVYAGALLSFAIFLRHLPDLSGTWHGAAVLMAPIVVTWASDTFAYFAGRAWGKTRLIPSVSPGKTVQGAIGSLVGSVFAALAWGHLMADFPTYRMGIPEAALFGVVISITAQVGDLAESLLKRDAAVKDSGRLFPGHGGALDRLDSLLFTLPIAYFFIRFFVGVGPVGG